MGMVTVMHGAGRWVALSSALVVVLVELVLASGPARAAEPGDNYPSPWRAAAQDSLIDSWGYYNRECTSWVAWALHNRNKFEMPRAIGDARGWGVWAANHRYAVNSTPAVGAVYWTTAPYGHVAWVKAVSGSTVTLQDYNNGYPSVRGKFEERRVTLTSSMRFIHFKDLSLVKTTAPSITGTSKVGSTLTANRGAWVSSSGSSPSASIAYRYQWLANGAAVPGATAATYTPNASMAGKRISVKVSVSASGYVGASATSAQTPALAPGALTNTGAPTVSGAPVVGGTLTASTGTWSPTPGGHAFQWYADGAVIDGATRPTLVPDASLVGKRLSVKVTATASGYASAAATSAQTAAVAPGTLTNTAAPTITGSPKVGASLTASTGSWTPAPDGYAYQWFADGMAVEGASGAEFIPGPAEVDKVLTVGVTAARSGYAAASSVSTGTPAVLPGDMANSTPPTLGGTAVVGETLSVVPGTWSPSPDGVAYQWFADDRPIDGATGTSLTLTPALMGASVSVAESASKVGYYDSALRSAPTAAVAAGTLQPIAVPALRGRARPGARLRVTPGSWRPSDVVLTFQWFAGRAPIRDARGATHRVRKGELKKGVSVRVEASAPGYGVATLTLRAKRTGAGATNRLQDPAS